MLFSLILTTIGRKDDLCRFFESLLAQSHQEFEVIVIDHKPNDVVWRVLDRYKNEVKLLYLGSALGHSKALNMGLSHCSGDVVAFPDDDCWYPDNLLQDVAGLLQRNPSWSGLAGRVTTAEGFPSNGRWDREPGFISKQNAWKRAVTVSLFFQRSMLGPLLFDESLGVGAGTLWGAGEETDYLLRVLEHNPAFYYDPTITVHHPEMTDGSFTPAVCAKAKAYGRGVGRVLRKHNYAIRSAAYHAARPAIGSVLALLTGRADKAHYHWSIASGRIYGYLYGCSVQHTPPVNSPKRVDGSGSRTRFTLVLATLGRTQEISRLFASLGTQTHQNFDIVLVDQNQDDRLVEIVSAYQQRFPIKHLRSAQGLSRARNLGLQHVAGDCVAFPDDDCWYATDTLQRAAATLAANPDWGGITGRSVDETGNTSAGRWDAHPGLLSRSNVWRRAISYTIFLRRSTVEGQCFNETLGVGSGTIWGAGEETDFLLRLLTAGKKIFYDPKFTVCHPEWHAIPYTPAACIKAFSYGRGMGRVLRLHSYSVVAIGYHLARPLAGVFFSYLTLRRNKARFHWCIFRGRIKGWLDSVSGNVTHSLDPRSSTTADQI